MPLFGILASTIGLLVTIPLFLSSPVGRSPSAKDETISKAISQPVYQELARAIDLLQTGETDAAGAVLDAQRTEHLIITSGGYAPGVMAEDSPTTVLMRLGRTIKATAINQAKAGKTEDALVWVARLHTLAEQALKTPVPSNNAVQMVYYFESTACRTERNIWEKAGNTKRVARAIEKGQRMETLWSTEIRPKMIASGNGDQISSLTGRDSSSRNNMIARNSETPSTNNLDAKESDQAKKLLKIMTATLRV